VIYSAYKSNLPIVLIGLPLIIVGLWLGQIIAGVDALPIENSSTLFGLLKQWFPWLWLEQAFAMLIIVLSGILLNAEPIFFVNLSSAIHSNFLK